MELGAYYNDELVSVMTFARGNISKGSKNVDGVWELSRFCTSKSIIGIAGKLLEFFKRNYCWVEIYSYADRRWSEGNVYSKIGFTQVSLTEPNYWYFKAGTLIREHRFNYRKEILIKEGYDINKTEFQIMAERGYLKIYDCGSIIFEKLL